VCHFAFGGAGRRNPYGLALEAAIQLGMTNAQALAAVENYDSDGDGYTNLQEIIDSAFLNKPTFPGLSAANLSWVTEVTPSDVAPYLTPSGSSDTTPPIVTLLTPSGGEVLAGGTYRTATYTASDASGIAQMRLYYSDDGGVSFKKIVDRAPHTGTINWFVPNLPGTQTIIRLEAVDKGGNKATDDNGPLTVTPQPGRAPTTLRDVHLPGTQPFEGAVLEDPKTLCVSCHGNYAPTVEPWQTWKGGMMAQAMRDPLFLACMAVAEQDAPSVGDLCLRCHTPGGWQEGRSLDTRGGMVNAKDREGIQCDFCHRSVDFNYVAGVSPARDLTVLSSLSLLPLQYGNGQFISDPAPLHRGPYADNTPTHQFLSSPFHKSSNICGTCHDVSSPVYTRTGTRDYTLTAFGQEHPDFNTRNMFPIERTFSEWSVSQYATVGVYAPQFAGTKPNGIVSTCQDCHMKDVNGTGCNQSGTPSRTDLPLHDFTGGNAFIGDLIPDFFPGEVDAAALTAAKNRAIGMLHLAATLQVSPTPPGIKVRVTNETAHKLPSGYPEGRRIWLNVVARDAANNVVFESGAYNAATGVLTRDAHAKIYEIHPGLSEPVAAALGLSPGESFHFVLNDTIYMDNRIPPRGFTNAAFEQIQSPPVHYEYADGQYWDDTNYVLPSSATSATVTLYYQTTTKEYVEFLRDENHTNTAGQAFYDAWVAHGRGAPIAMAQATTSVQVTGVGDGENPLVGFGLAPARPNPFSAKTRVSYALETAGAVKVRVFDISGREVTTLVDARQDAGRHEIAWDGRDGSGRMQAGGIYFIRLESGSHRETQRVVLVP
jgi:hypothetical protein